jgi:hypothetical protein
MKHRPIFLTFCLASAILLIGWTREDAPPMLAELMRRAEAIKPSATELKWQQIPWQTDLAKGQRVAQEERRPILLWVTGDDPLERC